MTDTHFETPAIDLPATDPQTFSVGMSIPSSTPMATRRMLARYRGMAKPLLDFKGAELTIYGAVFHGDYVRDQEGTIIQIIDEETGEATLKTGLRTILRTDRGLLTSTSPVTAKWVQDDLIPLFTTDGQMGDLIEPVKVRIENVKTKSGKYTYGFSFLD